MVHEAATRTSKYGIKTIQMIPIACSDVMSFVVLPKGKQETTAPFHKQNWQPILVSYSEMDWEPIYFTGIGEQNSVRPGFSR